MQFNDEKAEIGNRTEAGDFYQSTRTMSFAPSFAVKRDDDLLGSKDEPAEEEI